MPSYNPDRWQRCHWQTDRRYYMAEVTQDLFGQWLLHRRWGSRTSARGGEQRMIAASYDEALHLLQVTAKRRKRRGYECVGETMFPVLSPTSPAASASVLLSPHRHKPGNTETRLYGDTD